ncbi:MAG TPA: hypothetical protein VH307_09005 [Streptosporangiaceae bacterium]|nr:hypothetical protein [Streptosporangiaceae bacterium]
MTAPADSTDQDRGGSRSGGGPRSGGQSRPPGADIAADLAAGVQRWLIRSGTRSVRRELTGQFRKTLGGSSAEPGDVWGTATTEPPPDESREAPECAWCPVCRAARRIRESGPGLGGQLAGAGDAVAAAVQEALSAFDSVLSARPRTDPAGSRPSRPASSSAAGPSAAGPSAAGPSAAGPSAAGRRETPSADMPSEGRDDEPDDRG